MPKRRAEADHFYDQIKHLTYAELELVIRDGKIAAAIDKYLGKQLSKANNLRCRGLLTDKEFDSIVRDTLTPEELATMLFDADGLVSMETPAAPRMPKKLG